MCKIPILFQLMSERNINAKTLADATGISTGNISDWKNGRSKPSTEKLSVLATYFGVTTDYLLGKEKAPTSLESILEQLENDSDGESDDELIQTVKSLVNYQLKLDTESKSKSLPKLTKDEKDLLKYYRSLDVIDKKIIIGKILELYKNI